MRKWLLVLVLCCVGCATSQIPNYLLDKHPYVKRVYATHDQALAASTQALEILGWKISQKLDPIIYEESQSSGQEHDQTMLVTDIRTTAAFFGTRYAKINLYVKSNENMTDIEIRYLTVTSILFKEIYAYRNDSEVDRIFSRIEAILEDK